MNLHFKNQNNYLQTTGIQKLQALAQKSMRIYVITSLVAKQDKAKNQCFTAVKFTCLGLKTKYKWDSEALQNFKFCSGLNNWWHFSLQSGNLYLGNLRIYINWSWNCFWDFSAKWHKDFSIHILKTWIYAIVSYIQVARNYLAWLIQSLV